MRSEACAARFCELVGEPPMQYLMRWRMHLTIEALHESHLSLSEISQRIGYASEAAFSTAFKRRMGIAPGRYRVSIATAEVKIGE